MRLAVLAPASGFREAEFFYVFNRLKEAGIAVRVAAADRARLTSQFGVPVEPCLTFAEVDSSRLDLLVLVGPHSSMALQNNAFSSLLSSHAERRGSIAAMAEAVVLLASLPQIANTQVASPEFARDAFRKAGAQLVEVPCVSENNIVTCADPAYLTLWMRQVMQDMLMKPSRVDRWGSPLS